MRRIETTGHGFLRQTLGRLTTRAIQVLSTFARRLGTPALATVPVSAAMLSRLPVVDQDTSLEDVAQLFIGGRNAEVAVVSNGETIGVFTRADITAGIEECGPHAPVAEAPKHDVVTVTPSDSLADVLDQLRAAPDSVAVLVDRGEPVGLLTFDRLVEYARGAA